MLVSGCNQSKIENAELENVEADALFVHEIIPIFESKCMSCHGNDPEKIEGGLNLSNYENLLQGGNSGEPSIVPGKPGKSLDDNKLTYFHGGRHKQLSQFGGELIKDLIV